jgi:hypothetical protein
LPSHCHHGAIKRIGDDDEGHGKTTSCRTVGELAACQQCRHNRHCSIMPCHAMTWEQNHNDHDDDHTWTCDDGRIRQACLQAKFTCFSLPWAHNRLVRKTSLSICNLAPRTLYRDG